MSLYLILPRSCVCVYVLVDVQSRKKGIRMNNVLVENVYIYSICFLSAAAATTASAAVWCRAVVVVIIINAECVCWIVEWKLKLMSFYNGKCRVSQFSCDACFMWFSSHQYHMRVHTSNDQLLTDSFSPHSLPLSRSRSPTQKKLFRLFIGNLTNCLFYQAQYIGAWHSKLCTATSQNANTKKKTALTFFFFK